MFISAGKYFALSIFVAAVLLFIPAADASSFCVAGDPNPMLTRELAKYGGAINVSWADLDSYNCSLIFFTYFNEVPDEAVKIYEYTDRNYVFWLGAPPPVPCIGPKTGVKNISGAVRLTEYCEIAEAAVNLQMEMISPQKLFRIGVLESENAAYPAILQSNGQKLIYFAYNAAETPGILECLIRSIENGDAETKRIERRDSQENADMWQNTTLWQNTAQNETGYGNYPRGIRTGKDAMMLACVLVILLFGGYLVWTN